MSDEKEQGLSVRFNQENAERTAQKRREIEASLDKKLIGDPVTALVAAVGSQLFSWGTVASIGISLGSGPVTHALARIGDKSCN